MDFVKSLIIEREDPQSFPLSITSLQTKTYDDNQKRNARLIKRVLLKTPVMLVVGVFWL